MTKILITSDTHGHYGPISDYILTNEDIDLLIHAGDGIEDVVNISYETKVPYYVVRGNNDYYSNEAYDKIIKTDGIKILLTHGHTHNVYQGFGEILQIAKDNNCKVAIHGHTHIYNQEEIDGITILNPGSISLPRDNNPGFMIMNVSNDKFDLQRIHIK